MLVTRMCQRLTDDPTKRTDYSVVYSKKKMTVWELLKEMPKDVRPCEEDWGLEDLEDAFYFTDASETRNYVTGDEIHAWHIEKAEDIERLKLYLIFKIERKKSKKV